MVSQTHVWRRNKTCCFAFACLRCICNETELHKDVADFHSIVCEVCRIWLESVLTLRVSRKRTLVRDLLEHAKERLTDVAVPTLPEMSSTIPRLVSTNCSSASLPGERHSCDHVKKALVAAAVHISPWTIRTEFESRQKYCGVLVLPAFRQR